MKVDIYLATSPSGKFYVGITKNGLKSRVWSHFNRAKSGSKLPFHECLRKYNKDVKFEILETTDSWEKACLLEKQYIIKFNSRINGYNITCGGEGTLGVKCPEHLKVLYRSQHLGKRKTTEQKLQYSIGKGGKPFLMINKVTNEITEWQSIRQCELETGVLKPHIWRCLKNLRSSTKGYIFRYKEAN